jgi:hypothetical protein
LRKEIVMVKNLFCAACIGVVVLATGCREEESAREGQGSQTPAPAPAPIAQAPGEHGRIPIGESTQAGLQLLATMDSPVRAGGEGAFDVVITGGKPRAVRFWVGSEDAKGSVKSRAEEETPDNWHTHVEIPDPLPPDSRFWVEVEPPTGEPFRVSFDLKVQ